MFRKILFTGMLFITLVAKAHQADVSTTMLVEKDNGTWVLQISSSLTAFQQEIRTHFSETPYKTPEEFQQMVLQHIKNNLHITFNEDQNIVLSNGLVKLGHETRVVFEVFDIPSDIKSIVVQNTTFKDIHRSQSALLLLKEGFNKKHFVLDEANNHTLELTVNGNEFLETGESEGSLFSSEITLVFITVVAAVFLAVKARTPKEVQPTIGSI